MRRALILLASTIALLAPVSATAATIRLPFHANVVGQSTSLGGNCCRFFINFEGRAFVPLLGRVTFEGSVADPLNPEPGRDNLQRDFEITFRTFRGSLTLAQNSSWVPGEEPDPGYVWTHAHGTGPFLGHVVGGSGTWDVTLLNQDELPPVRIVLAGTLVWRF